MSEYFGLDIGSESIKIVQLAREKNTFCLVTAGITKTPVATLSFDSEKDIVATAEAIKKLKDEAKVVTNNVVFSLPEKNVFAQVIELPKMKEEQLEQTVLWEAENIIPQPISEVNLDWQLIDDEIAQKSNKIKVLVVAVPSEQVSKYLHILELAGLVPVSAEPESLSIIRCLKPVISQENLVLLNMGGKSLDVILVCRGNFYLSRQLPTAGEAITRAISSSLGLDFPVAEEYKKTYGLSPQLEGKVASAIEPVLAAIVNEVRKSAAYFVEKTQLSLKLMILIGGTSLLPGITEYFTKLLGVETQVADPLSLYRAGEQTLFKKNSALFTTAFGLAMK